MLRAGSTKNPSLNLSLKKQVSQEILSFEERGIR